jgi:hypothetical protein
MLVLPAFLIVSFVVLMILVPLVEGIYREVRDLDIPIVVKGLVAGFVVAYYRIKSEGINAKAKYWRYFFQVGFVIALLPSALFCGNQHLLALVIGLGLILLLYLPQLWDPHTGNGVLFTLSVVIIMSFCAVAFEILRPGTS